LAASQDARKITGLPLQRRPNTPVNTLIRETLSSHHSDVFGTPSSEAASPDAGGAPADTVGRRDLRATKLLNISAEALAHIRDLERRDAALK
jgi:hypothetical protein